MEAPTGSGIELAVVLRFVDVAVDALADAREEIDALNVYPVPDGDTGTNMYLTMSAARDAVREAAAPGRRPRAALDGVPPRRAARRPRQLRRDPQRDARRDRRAGSPAPPPGERNAAVMVDAMAEATEASYAAVGTPVEGTILTVARAASDAAVRRAGRAAGAGSRRLHGQPPRRPARRSRAPPSSCRQLARRRRGRRRRPRARASILDAAETVLTGRRRDRAGTDPLGARHHPGGHGRSPTSTGRRAGVRGDVPARRRRPDAIAQLRATWPRSATPSSWSAARACGTSTSTSTTSAPPSRPASRPADRTGSGSPTSPSRSRRPPERAEDRAGRRIVAVAAGPGLPALFGEAGAIVVEGAPGRRPSTGMLLEAIVGSGAAEVVSCPTTPTRCAPPRSRPAPPRRTTPSGSR